MCNLESLKIDLKELNEGLTTLHFNLGDAYFESLDEDEIKRGSVSVSLNVRRTENYLSSTSTPQARSLFRATSASTIWTRT